MDAGPYLDLATPWLLGGLLIAARVAAVTVWLPGLTSTSAPPRVRLMATLVFAVILDLGLGGVAVALPTSPLALGLMVLREVLIGAAMGLAIRILLAGIETAGSLAGISMGLSLNVFVDPTSGNQSLPLGSLLGLGAALVFVAMDGHRLVLWTLFEHLQHFPVGVIAWTPPSPATIARLGGDLATTALQLAAPVMAITLVLNIALAFVSRAMPSVNLFGIGLSMLIVGGLLAMAMFGEAVVHHVDHGLEDLPADMVDLAGSPGRP
ncbi:MAG: flagellar biosynthetic protein FliR [Myxococcota bacterium]